MRHKGRSGERARSKGGRNTSRGKEQSEQVDGTDEKAELEKTKLMPKLRRNKRVKEEIKKRRGDMARTARRREKREDTLGERHIKSSQTSRSKAGGCCAHEPPASI